MSEKDLKTSCAITGTFYVGVEAGTEFKEGGYFEQFLLREYLCFQPIVIYKYSFSEALTLHKLGFHYKKKGNF